MKEKGTKKGKRILYIFLFIAFLLMFVSTLYQKHLNTLPQDYTVGEIQDIWQPANGEISVKFTYYLDQEYSDSENIGEYLGKLNEGERYLVKVPEGHPERGIMLFQYPVPDSIVAPEEGWDELPEFAR